jgi:predicted ATPase
VGGQTGGPSDGRTGAGDWADRVAFDWIVAGQATDADAFGAERCARGDIVAPRHLALVRILTERGIPELDWLDHLAQDWSAILIEGTADRIYELPSSRTLLDFSLAVHRHRTPRPLFQSVSVVFGNSDGIGAAARIQRLESVADKAWPGCVIGLGRINDALAAVRKQSSKSLGRHRFDDMLPEEEAVSYTDFGDLEVGHFSIDGLDLYDHNLPVFFDSFVGRSGDLDNAIGASSSTRIVTLTGCGGSGKTRLAIHAAARLAHDGYEAIRLIRLAETERAADIGGALARQAGIRSAKLDDFIRAYRARKLLLILDNCEHVLDSVVAVVRRLIDEMPGVQLLATSREPLDLGGEVTISVDPLRLPPEDEPIIDIGRFGATKLFIDRLGERTPSSSFGPDTWSQVASICRKVDGLPLAIEHAAGQAAYIGLDQCERGLTQRFELLRSTRRDYDDRHRTIWATIDWSYSLLDEHEKRCLAALSVFTGSFSITDAEPLLLGMLPVTTRTPSVVASLVRKSLVCRSFDHKGIALFHLLETIRDFASKHASQDGRLFEDRLYDHVCSLIEQAYQASEGAETGVTFADLREKYATIHDVLNRAVGEGRTDVIETLRKMTRYWSEHGPVADGVSLLSQSVTPLLESEDCPLLAANALAVMLWLDGQAQQARSILRTVIDRAYARNDLVTAANAQNNLGGVEAHVGNHADAARHFESAFRLYRDNNAVAKAGMCAANVGYSLARCGEYGHSAAFLRSVIDQGPSLALETEVVILMNLSDAERMNGNCSESLRTLVRMLEKCASSSSLSAIPNAILRACVLAIDLIDPKDIAFLYGMATSGFAEFSSAEFPERAEMRAKVEAHIEAALGAEEALRIVSQGSIKTGSSRVENALRILKSRIDSALS